MKKTLSIAIFVFSIQLVLAQENLNNEVIDVVKDFRPKVMQANKIKSQPQFVDTTKVSENLSYKIRFEDFRVQQKNDSLLARIEPRFILDSLYSKQVTLGFGSLSNPRLAFGIDNGRNTRQMYQAQMSYDGAFSNKIPRDDEYSNLSTHATYKHIFAKQIFQSKLHLYNIHRNTTHNQKLQNSGVHLNSELQFTENKSIYVPNKISMDAQLYYQDVSFAERKVSFLSEHAGIYKQFKEWILRNSLAFQKSGDYYYVHWKTKAKLHKLIDLADLQFALEFDVLGRDMKLIPEFKAQYPLIEKGLYAYLELGGNRSMYTLAEFYKKNPYLHDLHVSDNSWINQIPSTTKYFSRIGLNGALFDGINYQFSVEACTQDNFLHFVHFVSNEDHSVQYMIPEFTNVNFIQLHGELHAEGLSKFQLWLQAEYRSFTEDLSYVPDIHLGLYTSYKYDSKWAFTGSIQYMGDREALTNYEDQESYFEEAMNLASFIDLSIKLDYRHHKQLNFYLEGINLADKDFIIWQDNPILGRRINFGANYLF